MNNYSNGKNVPGNAYKNEVKSSLAVLRTIKASSNAEKVVKPKRSKYNFWNIVKKLSAKINFRFNRLHSLLYHNVTFRIQDIVYENLPLINGKLIIKNEGSCVMGKNLKFNSSIRSNYVGLSKPCTISVRHNGELVIGDFSGFSGVSIVCSNKITIGKYLNCGGNVSIWDTDFHPIEYRDRRAHDMAKINSAPVEIGNDVFIGANSIVLKGITIGDRAVVGAGSVVTKNIPPDQIWAGNPAKFIKHIV